MIKVCFILLTVVMLGLVAIGTNAIVRKTVPDTPKQKRIVFATLLSLLCWLIYIVVVSLSGVLATTALPPRIPLFLILPAFSFMFYFFLSDRFKEFVAAVPLKWLTYTQSFRIAVELMLHTLFLQGLLPRAATFEGYNFEIVIGVTALLVGYFGFTNGMPRKGLLLAWNVAGLGTLAIIVFIMITHAYLPAIWPGGERLAIENFGAFPFTFLAGFLMPLAVFMHIFSIVKMRRNKY
jgi:hypothetical protein